MKKAISITLSVIMALTLLAGCGSAPAAEPTPAGQTGSGSLEVTGDNTTITAAEGASALVSDEPISITISSADAVLTMDNHNSSGSIYEQIIPLWGDTLFASQHNGQFDPWIAKEWTWSDDYLTLTLTIRDDVYFCNGENVTAEDVAFTFNRVAQSIEDVTSTSLKAELSEAAAVGDYTVEFHFTEVCAKFMNFSMKFPIISKAAWEASPETFWSSPVGTGPYYVDSFDGTNSLITFKRNENWWAADEQNTTNVDIIYYRQISDTTSRLAALRAGEVDYINDIPLDQIDTLTSEGFTAISFVRDRPYFLFCQCDEGKPFADINMRKALSLCINRQEIVDYIIGGGEVADWPFSSNMFGYRPGSGYEYNVEEAARLVSESDYDGSEISFMVSTAVHSRSAEIAAAIQANAAAAGINLKVDLLEQATVTAARRSGDYSLMIAGSPQTHGEGFTLYTNEFSGKDSFHTGYVNEKQFELISKASQTVDPAERNEILQDALQEVMDGYAFIFLFQPTEAFAINSQLSNITVYNDGIHDLRYITVLDTGA